MNRRRFLAAAGGGLVPALTGCLGDTDEPGSKNTESPTRTPRSGSAGFEPHAPESRDPPALPPGPEEPPERPAEVTIDAVSEYVTAFEYAYVYNVLHCRDLRDIDVVSEAVLERETDHGVYAFAAATGYSTCGSGAEPEHTDFGRDPYEYAVGEDYVVRIDDRDTTVDRDRDRAYDPNDAGTGAAGLSVTNFDHLAHDIDVRVAHGDETAYDGTVTLDPRSSARLPNVSAVHDDHELSVETDDGATARGTWSVDPERPYDRMVRVLATGKVSVGYLDPYGELGR